MLPGKIIEADPQPALSIELAKLPADMRRPVWEWIQMNKPALGQFLGSDLCSTIKESFADVGCSAVLDLNDEEATALTQQLPGITRWAT